MQPGEVHDWLEATVQRQRREHVAMGLLAGVSGAAVTLITTTVGTVILVGVIGQVFKIGQAWLDWQTAFPPDPANIAMVAAGLALLQSLGFRRRDTDYIFRVAGMDWRASENIGLLLSFLWAVLLDLLHSGPRMLLFAGRQLGQRRALKAMDQDVCGDVLNLLHCNDHRVSFAHLQEFVPEFEIDRHLPQLLLLRGILHLPSEPPGLSLGTDLRKQLGAPTQAQIRAARIPPRPTPPPEEDTGEDATIGEPFPSAPRESKPPAFRCAGCHKKFRLRNLQGGVTFSCPRCGELYRIERQSEDYDPTADLSVTDDGAQAFFALGLHPAATRAEVKRAYRELMKEYHPDKAAGLSPVKRKLLEERAREINRAYGEVMDRLGG
jgi:predicted RNA-binding Zn-ribbon protein involved in translation (DUF1610 family)